MASAFLCLCCLALAGAVLHLAWRLALAALIWAPSAASGIIAGWHVALWFENAGLGVAAAIGAAALTRTFVNAVMAWLTPRRVLLVAWTEYR
jgi:hypothetical protein